MKSANDRQLLCVVFTDIEGYSALTQQDEKKAFNMVSRYQDIVTRYTTEFQGKLVQFYGDGSLTTFNSAIHAVESAIEMQRAFRLNNLIPVRIGIHLGDILFREHNIYGDAVNIASRLQSLSISGSVLVSDAVAKEFEHHPDIKVKYLGVERVKNINKPIKIYAVEDDKLLVPEWQDVHRKNPWIKRTPYLIPLILVLAILGVFVLKQYMQTRNDNLLMNQRVAVIPFKNETGDSTLNFIGTLVSYHISKCLTELEDTKTVSFMNIVQSESIQELGVLNTQMYYKNLQAQYVIEGNYYLLNDSTLQFTSGLRKTSDLQFEVYFPDIQSTLQQYSKAIVEMGQRVAGYWDSKSYMSLSIPTQNAFRAFEEALRFWKRDYGKAIKLLDKAIELDSTFIDAYFYRIDAYYNQNDRSSYEKADSALQNCKKQFDIHLMTDDQRNRYYYYEALVGGNNKEAYKILKKEYDKDPNEIYTNTSMALLALQYVNEPELALDVLKQIPFDSIDFETFDHYRDRITYAMQANILLEKYREAAKYISYYPQDSIYSVHQELIVRTLAYANESLKLDNYLKEVQLTQSSTTYAHLLYTLSLAYKRVGDDEKQRHFALQAIKAYGDQKGYEYVHLLLDIDSFSRAIKFLTPIYKDYPEYPGVKYSMARAFAESGNKEKALSIITELEKRKQEAYDYGSNYYEECLMYMHLGDYEKALIKLKQAINDGLFFHAKAVDNDPYLKPLYKFPEYKKITHPLRN